MSTAEQQKPHDSNDAMTTDNNDVVGAGGGGGGGGGGGNDDGCLTGEKGAARAGRSEAEAGVIAMETETGSSPDTQQQQPPPQPPAPAPAPTLQQPGTIPYARWPDDAPFKLERKVMSIIVGHTSIHWALHEGSDHQFVPTLFWKYVISVVSVLFLGEICSFHPPAGALFLTFSLLLLLFIPSVVPHMLIWTSSWKRRSPHGKCWNGTSPSRLNI